MKWKTGFKVCFQIQLGPLQPGEWMKEKRKEVPEAEGVVGVSEAVGMDVGGDVGGNGRTDDVQGAEDRAAVTTAAEAQIDARLGAAALMAPRPARDENATLGAVVVGLYKLNAVDP
jgi:hypothetical protein